MSFVCAFRTRSAIPLLSDPLEPRREPALETDALVTLRRLAGLVDADGRFNYKFDLITGHHYPSYNVLRHSGCVWALATCGIGRALPEAASSARLAVTFLLDNFTRAASAATTCIVEGGVAKLGGSALAVLALLTQVGVVPNLERHVERLCGYLLSQRLSPGKYVDKRDAISGTRLPFLSDYYTGQTIFALLEAYKAFGCTEYLRCAEEDLTVLLPRQYGVVSQNHWMMYAVSSCYEISRHECCMEYARAFVRALIANPSYRLDGRPTPIACRTEALNCFIRMAGSESGTGAPLHLVQDAFREADTNIALQNRSRTADGSYTSREASTTVRIDFLQHNAMSMLGLSSLSGLRGCDVAAYG